VMLIYSSRPTARLRPLPTYPTLSPCGHNVRSSLGLRAHRQPDKPINASGFHLAFDLFLFASTSSSL
jgi:hypothetical protein